MRSLAVLLPSSALLAPLPSHALDFSIEAFHEAEYSTNVGRTSGGGGSTAGDEDEGWIHQPGARIATSHDSESLSLTGDYDARRRIYDTDGYDDETAVTGSASATWRALPDRLTFDVSNTRTETTIDSREPFAPENRQVTSTTSAGTSLQIDSFGAQFLSLGYRHDWSNTNETADDSQTDSGTLSYVIPLSSTRRFQINGRYGEEDFDNELTPNTQTTSGDLEFSSTGATIDIDVAIGYTLIERELNRDDVDGMNGRGQFTWHVSSDTTASLSYAHAITSDTPSALAGISTLGEEFDENSALNEVYTSDDLSLTFATVIGRNQLTLGGSYRTLNYEDVPQDEENASASVSLERRIRPTVTGSLYSNFKRTEFKIDERQDNEWDAGLRIAWTGFRRLTISTSAQYSRQSSDDAANEYDEWSGVISLSYLLLGTR